jgi:hypothetical protein
MIVQIKSRCKFPDDIFAGPKHVEIIKGCQCVPEHFYFIISVVSFYLAVRPHVATREQFNISSGILLIFCLFLLILIKILQFNRLFARRHKRSIFFFVVRANGEISVGAFNGEMSVGAFNGEMSVGAFNLPKKFWENLKHNFMPNIILLRV